MEGTIDMATCDKASDKPENETQEIYFIEEEDGLSDATMDVDDDEETIIKAVQAIVKATNDQGSAMRAVNLLEQELKKALGEATEDEDDDDDAKIERLLKEGRLVPEKHKKSEGDRWRDLLVTTLPTVGADDGDRRK